MCGVLPPAEQGEHPEAEDGHRGQAGEEADPEEDPVDADLHRAGLPHHLRHAGGDDALLHERLPGPGRRSSACLQQYQLLAKSRPPAELTAMLGKSREEQDTNQRAEESTVVQVQCL